MQITCPACAATYEVPDHLLAPGRRARCARCGNEWEPSADASAPEPEPESGPELGPELGPGPAPESRVRAPEAPLVAAPAQMLATPRKPPRRRPGVAIWLGWAASLAIVVYASYAATHHRNAVMRSWPPSARLYSALGLAASAAKP
jgi:predicted Zn finger-like uncharacterized protein